MDNSKLDFEGIIIINSTRVSYVDLMIKYIALAKRIPKQLYIIMYVCMILNATYTYVSY